MEPRVVMRQFVLPILILWIAFSWAVAEAPPLSEATEACVICHEILHPGIVEGWRTSRHAKITTGRAAELRDSRSRVSSEEIPESLVGVAVGCAECHMCGQPG
jgi:hypothetical protein